jgi:hypothetical protein
LCAPAVWQGNTWQANHCIPGGAGTGYLKQRDVEDQRKRDDEDQQFKRDQREVWRKQAEADSLNQSLKQAQAPAEVVEGPLGDQSAGPPVPMALSQAAAVSQRRKPSAWLRQGSANLSPPQRKPSKPWPITPSQRR